MTKAVGLVGYTLLSHWDVGIVGGLAFAAGRSTTVRSIAVGSSKWLWPNVGRPIAAGLGVAALNLGRAVVLPVATGYAIGAFAGTAVSQALWGESGARTALDFYGSPYETVKSGKYASTLKEGFTWDNFVAEYATSEIPLGYLIRETKKTARGQRSELFGTL